MSTTKLQHKFINDLDTNKKNNFKNRTVISIFVVIFYLIILGLTILADQTKSAWTSFDIKVSGIFALALVVVVYIPFIFAVLEAIKLVFRKHEKIPIIILMIVSTIAYIIPVLTLIFTNYFVNHFFINTDNNSDSETAANFLLYSKLTYTTIISSFVSWIILIIVLNIVLKAFYKANFKNVITLNALLMIIVFGFNGFIFISIFKGWTALLFLLISVLATDALCYIWGLFFGKHKMAKIISPNKTWEGAILGSVSSVALLMIYCGLLTIDNKVISVVNQSRWLITLQDIASFSTVNEYSLWILVFFVAVLLVIFAILGDLLFSYVKRSFGIKDFSNYLKSHGGFLDRVDSLLVVSLIFFIYSLIAISVYSFVNFPTAVSV